MIVTIVINPLSLNAVLMGLGLRLDVLMSFWTGIWRENQRHCILRKPKITSESNHWLSELCDGGHSWCKSHDIVS
jgi:hypothetical protein